MRLETKYDFDEAVWHIRQEKRKEWHKCGFCGGKCSIQGEDGSRSPCMVCHGKGGKPTLHEDQWRIADGGPLTVGQVRSEVCNEHHADDECGPGDTPCDSYGREEYMMRETGIGYGSVAPIFYGEDLFSSRGEAQSECDRRNGSGGVEADEAELRRLKGIEDENPGELKQCGNCGWAKEAEHDQRVFCAWPIVNAAPWFMDNVGHVSWKINEGCGCWKDKTDG